MLDKLSTEIRQQVEKGIAILKQGGVIAFPTDTVYGLGACADIPGAVERIYRIKKRPNTMALPVLVADADMIEKISENITPIAWRLIHHFLPGGLTLVLPKARSVPDIITGGANAVAIRIPNHSIPLALIKGTGCPIIGTSANLSGKPSPLTAEEVSSQLGDRVDLIIDGGQCPGGKESTVVDVTGEVPVIIREEAISKAEIADACGCAVLSKEK